MNRAMMIAAAAGFVVMTAPYPSATATPLGVTRSAAQAPDSLIEQVARGGGRGGGGHARAGGGGGARMGGGGGAHRSANVSRAGSGNRNVNRNANVNRNVNKNVNRNVNRNVTRVGNWTRPGNYWWRAGGAVAAGAAIGYVSASAAAAWAGPAPGPDMCWYYTDASKQDGFWDVCP